LLPGSFGQLGYVTGTGGSISQGMALFSGMAKAGAGGLGEDWMAAARRADSQDGAEVHIIIPLIDYGYTGSFNNAEITVSRANSGVYQAVGPEDVIPGQDVGYPLSGHVTIERYSPTVLKGSFSAALVDMSRVPITKALNPTLPIHASIKGDFNIVAPWQGDNRNGLTSPYEDVEQLKQDMTEAYPFLGNRVDEMVDQMVANRKQGSGNGPAQAQGAAGSCDCSCNRLGMSDPVCEPVCRVSFSACGGKKFEPPEGIMDKVHSQETSLEKPVDSSELARLRQRFRELLKERYPGENLKSTRGYLLQLFDAMDTIEQRKNFVTVYENDTG